MNATEESTILDQYGRPLAIRTPAERQADLIGMAIDKGMDADAIAKLVDLIERREAKEAEKQYTDAIRVVSEKAGVIVKSKMGSKAKYAPLDEVNYILTPIYTGAGLSLSFSEADCPFADKGWKRHVCDVCHIAGHKQRYHLDLPLVEPIISNQGKEAMSAIQGAIATGSYCQRVLLCRIFNLTIAATDLDGGRPDEPLTDDQIKELNGILADYEEARGEVVFMDKFLAAFGGEGCKRISDFTVSQFNEACADLKRKIAQARKAGAK